jgi:hypothetical protein
MNYATETINGLQYMYFFDKSIKSWTVLQIDINQNQIGNAEYFANKQSLLNIYNFIFRIESK